ncbi:recombination regulator RecX [Brochothrix campestris]|uniref:Regulatory protein RecX n=1 Tax=Brochothrix campestris FSL F6-1037 TaxID=1265861 RepID=W7C7S8_9LIST|nr:recombination regulator RecX [Brochothrix campestris]EUJ35494.1 recombination regulator RecX [Brochothrix campestris FSL F6-1037]
MKKITKIEVQKKNEERFNIYINDEFSCGVDMAVLTKLGLRKGMEVDDDLLAEMTDEETHRKAINRALVYLAVRMRSEKEIIADLQKKEYEEDAIDAALVYLRSNKFVDDNAFAKMFCRTMVNTTLKGPQLIIRELRQKGIAENDIEEALTYFTDELHDEHLYKVLHKVARTQHNVSQVKLKQKLQTTVMVKGYYGNKDVLESVLQEFVSDEEEADALKLQYEKFERKFSKYKGYEQKSKIIKGLMQKGFKYEAIQNMLADLDEEY